MPESTGAATGEIEWLPLGKAAVLLGVHSMTLRRWSDNGRFPSYRTAGGHRRFALEDIQSYLARQQAGSSDQMNTNWADKALVQTRREVSHHMGQRWLQQIDGEELRGEYRQLGHQLMGLLLQFVAAEEPDGSFIEEAKRMGRQYGAYGVKANMPLSSMIEATLFFRDILIESSLQVPTQTYVKPDASLRILRRVNKIINAIQLSITEFYETGEYFPKEEMD